MIAPADACMHVCSAGAHSAALRAVTRYLHLQQGDGSARLLAARILLQLGRPDQVGMESLCYPTLARPFSCISVMYMVVPLLAAFPPPV